MFGCLYEQIRSADETIQEGGLVLDDFYMYELVNQLEPV